MYNLCTLFDKNYAAKGLALYRSLEKTTDDFHLNILALDKETCDALVKLNLKKASITPLSKIKPLPEVRQIANRPWKYFCWSMGSLWTKIVWDNAITKQMDDASWSDMERYLPSSDWYGYIDSDCFFTMDARIPSYELEERKKCVGIVPHRFPSHDYQRLIGNGKYNVSLVLFREEAGNDVLRWWTERCVERCDEFSVGDQKYLDKFHELVSPNPVHDIINPGVGLAPWNISQYTIKNFCDIPVVFDHQLNTEFALVFYHYHELKKNKDGSYFFTGYPLKEVDIEVIYKPYIYALNSAERELANAGLHLI